MTTDTVPQTVLFPDLFDVPQTVLFPDLFDKPLFARFNQWS